MVSSNEVVSGGKKSVEKEIETDKLDINMNEITTDPASTSAVTHEVVITGKLEDIKRGKRLKISVVDNDEEVTTTTKICRNEKGELRLNLGECCSGGSINVSDIEVMMNQGGVIEVKVK